MKSAQDNLRSFVTQLRGSPVRLIAVSLVVVGLCLGIAVHRGWMALMAIGAFGPGVLRQLGWLDDLDEFQKEAAAMSGLRAYLAGGLFLMVALIAETWNRLDLGADLIPASTVVTVMLVVYYASYCLSFWDTRLAVSWVLLAFGLLWLAFVVLSHAGEPMALLSEGLVVPGPFILGAILCRWWPRVVGLALLAACASSIYFFHMLPIGETDAQRVFQHVFMLVLIPLPLAVTGVALVASRDESVKKEAAVI
jgi:hypothetical protein